MSEQTTCGPVGMRDEATRIAYSLNDQPPELPLDPHEAFVSCYPRIRSLAKGATSASVLVAAVASNKQVLQARLVEAGQALVIGRHSRCAIRLPGESIALRQLVTLVRLDEETPILHLWDVNTETRFFTEDGQSNAAVMADGPVYISIGGHALWFVPWTERSTWPECADKAWEALPRRAFIHRRPHYVDRVFSANNMLLPPSPWGRNNDEEISHVTSLKSPLLLGDPDNSMEIGWGLLCLQYNGSKHKHRVSAECLERGVLVGRYPRCSLHVDSNENGISRVHVLLVKIGSQIWAIDTASKNGLWRENAPLVSGILADEDTLRLGRNATLRWQRQKHPQA